jgi:DNA polymerase III delta prime subunit
MSTRDQILQLKQRMGESIIGQEQVIERLLLTLLANGNLLLEGLPGLAKTRAVKSLARNLESEFRPETVTYICEHPGQFTLPALVIPWWDLKNQQLMRVTLPAVTLEVEPGPVQSTDTTAPSAAAPGRWWLWWTLGAMLLLVAAMAGLWHERRALLAAWERRHMQRQAGEAGLFAQLLDACHADDAKAVYNALLRWLDARHRGHEAATIDAFLADHPGTDLRQQVEMLQEAVLGRDTRWDGVALADGLRQARRQDLRRSRQTEDARLPDLNPR